MKKYLVFVGMGFELLGIVMATMWLGMWIETKTPMRNLWPVMLVILGLAGWFYRVILLLKKLNKENEK